MTFTLPAEFRSNTEIYYRLIGHQLGDMDTITYLIRFLLITTLTFAVLFIHEITHIFVARVVGNPSITVLSWVPLRLNVNFCNGPVSSAKVRLVAVAPALTGVGLAVLFVIFDGIDWLSNQSPYYLSYIATMYWLLYSHISVADLRTFIYPYRQTGQ